MVTDVKIFFKTAFLLSSWRYSKIAKKENFTLKLKG